MLFKQIGKYVIWFRFYLIYSWVNCWSSGAMERISTKLPHLWNVQERIPLKHLTISQTRKKLVSKCILLSSSRLSSSQPRVIDYPLDCRIELAARTNKLRISFQFSLKIEKIKLKYVERRNCRLLLRKYVLSTTKKLKLNSILLRGGNCAILYLIATPRICRNNFTKYITL